MKPNQFDLDDSVLPVYQTAINWDDTVGVARFKYVTAKL